MNLPCYSECLSKDNILLFEEATQIMELIMSSAEGNITEGAELIRTMICYAIDYASIRARWGLLSTLELSRMNETRSQYHDMFIQATDKLADYLLENGCDIVWREKLGDDRKRIGDFACYLAYIQGIDAR